MRQEGDEYFSFYCSRGLKYGDCFALPESFQPIHISASGDGDEGGSAAGHGLAPVVPARPKRSVDHFPFGHSRVSPPVRTAFACTSPGF